MKGRRCAHKLYNAYIVISNMQRYNTSLLKDQWKSISQLRVARDSIYSLQVAYRAHIKQISVELQWDSGR